MSDNTGSNLGTGQGIFGSKVGDDLQFKSLVGGSGITLSADANEITINSSALVSSATNLGSETGLFVDLTSGSLNFKSLAISTGLSIANTGTTVTISVDSANLNAGTLGGLASSVFLQKSDNLASVTDVSQARTNLGVYSKTETDAKYFTNSADSLPDTDNTRSVGSSSKRYSDMHAVEFHGTATYAGSVASIATHDIGGLQNVDETGKASGHVLKYDGTNWVSTVDGGATNLGALTDVDTAGIANGQVLKFNSSTSKFEAADDSGAGGGSSTFVGLSDTPNNYSGAASKFVKANAGGNALEFVADPGYITDLTSFTTANLTENTNLYYTDARADARIGAASINALSDVDTSGVSTNDTLKWNGTNWVPTTAGSGIALTDLSVATGSASGGGTLSYNSGTGAFSFAPADLSSYLTSVPAQSFASLTSKPTTLAGYGITDGYTNADVDTHLNQSNPTSGYVLSWNGSDYAWVAQSGGSSTLNGLTDVTITSASSGQVLKYNGSAWVNDTDAGGIALTDLSTTTAAASGGGTLSYNNGTGAFTFAPADLSSYQTTAGLNGAIDTHLNQSNPTSGYVLSWNGSDYAWVTNGSGGITDIVNDTTPQLGGTLDANGQTIDMGTNVLTDANLGQFITAYGWGNHASAGYLTSVPAQTFASLTSKPTTIAGYGITDALVLGTSSTTALAGNTTFSFASLTSKPTTIAGYGITDGFANSDIDTHLNQSNPTSGYVLSWNGSDYAWVNNAGYTNTDFDNRLATKTTANLTEGSNLYYTDARADARITNAGSGNWNTAYGWGNHASAGYLTSVPAQTFASLTSKPTTIAGYGITDALALGTSATTALAGNTSLFDGVFASLTSKPTTLAGYGITDSLQLGTSATTALAGDTTLFDNSAFDTRLGTKSTTNLSEGTNLYYTDVRADARITNAILDEDNMASDSNTKVPTQQSVKAYVDSQVASENELSEMNDVTIASLQNNQFLKYNTGTSKWENVTVTAASAAGNDTHVQFNDGGVMGGDSGFTYNKTTDALTVGSISTSGASGSVSSTADLDITTSANNSNIGIVPHGTGDIELGTNVLIDGSDNGYLKWTAPYSNEAALPSASTYHGMFAHVHGTGKGYFAHGGNWIKLLDESSSTTTNLTEGTNLYYTDARADARITAALIDEDNMASNSATRLPSQQSVKAYVDSQILTKDNTDEITEGSSNLYFTDARADTRITAATLDEDNMASDSNTKIATQQSIKAYVDSSTSNSSNWDTAYGWGNHASAGYLSSETFTSVVQDTTPQLGGTLDANGNTIDMGTNILTDTKVGYWDTAYGWGDHASASYLTSVPAQTFASLTSKPTTLAGYGITDGYANADVDTHINQSNPTSGYVLSWNGSDYAWVAQSGGASAINDLTDVTITSATSGQVLKYNGSAWVNGTDAGGIALTDLSVGAEGSASGDGAIAYNSGTGVFTYTPPTAAGIGALADLTGSDLDTLADVNNTAPTDGQVLTWDNSNSYWKPATPSGGGGGGTTYEEFKINYSTSGQVQSISDTSSGLSSVSIDSAAGGDLTVNFTGYNTPPLSFAMYGYNYAANKYNYNTVASGSMTLRELPGGGSSGSPTAFGSFSNMQIRCSESETGASRSFGTVTHAWVRFVMGA